MDIDDRAEYLEGIGLRLGWNKGLVKCQICHDRWHSWEYETCYDCRPPWLTYNRKEFSESQKIDIFDRDRYKCAACDSRDGLQVDHIMPCARGGEADQWNGQVLCDKCNYEKAADWKNTHWPKQRNWLMHMYLTFWWFSLSNEERELLVAEASNKRVIIGYRPISGIVKVTELEARAAKNRKIVIDKATPMVRFAGTRLVLVEDERVPVPEYINVVSGQMEEHRPFNHGDEFLRHGHVSGFREPPQWAIDEADLCTDLCLEKCDCQ